MTVCRGWRASYDAALRLSLVARDSSLQVKEEGSFRMSLRARPGGSDGRGRVASGEGERCPALSLASSERISDS